MATTRGSKGRWRPRRVEGADISTETPDDTREAIVAIDQARYDDADDIANELDGIRQTLGENGSEVLARAKLDIASGQLRGKRQGFKDPLEIDAQKIRLRFETPPAAYLVQVTMGTPGPVLIPRFDDQPSWVDIYLYDTSGVGVNPTTQTARLHVIVTRGVE